MTTGRTIHRALIGHEDFALGTGKVSQNRGSETVVLQRIELPFIFREVSEIKDLNYNTYVHIGLHQTGAVIEYYFDPDSLAVAEDNLYIKPNTIPASEPGRYIRIVTGLGNAGDIIYAYTDVDYVMSYAQEVVLVDSTNGPITITLPSNPVKNDYAGVWDCGKNASIENITILRNGETIHGLNDDALLDRSTGRFDFIHTGITWEFATIYGCQGGQAGVIEPIFDTIVASATNEYSAIAVSAGRPEVTFRASFPLDMTNGYIRINLTTAAVGDDMVIDLRMNGVTIFDDFIRIDDGTDTSVISTNQSLLAITNVPDDAKFEAYVMQVGSVIAGTGLKVSVTGQKIP